MNLKQLFGKNVKKYRDLKNLSQETLGEMIGVDSTSISALENGKYFITAENLSKLADALNVSVCDLFYFDALQTNEAIYNDILKFLDLYKNDSSKLNAIKRFILSL